MSFFYYSQLLAWTDYEFDKRVLSYEVVNRWFDGDSSSIFVAFYVRYIDSDRLVYIANENREDAIKELDKYAKAINVVAVPTQNIKCPAEEIETWNRVKMLNLASQYRDKITTGNLKSFARSLKVSEIDIEGLECLPEYPDREGVAYALELVRMGAYSFPKIKTELLKLNSVISIKEVDWT